MIKNIFVIKNCNLGLVINTEKNVSDVVTIIYS